MKKLMLLSTLAFSSTAWATTDKPISPEQRKALNDEVKKFTGRTCDYTKPNGYQVFPGASVDFNKKPLTRNVQMDVLVFGHRSTVRALEAINVKPTQIKDAKNLIVITYGFNSSKKIGLFAASSIQGDIMHSRACVLK